jgi:hypothetical protein
VYKTKREYYECLRSQLENERASFLPHWRDLGEFILPRRPRFFTADVNKGDRRTNKIYDSTGTLAVRTLRSGMMSGATSPARPWFRVTTFDPDLAEYNPMKQWLYSVSQRMSSVFIQSNVYNSLPIVYGDMGTFGTAALFFEEDDEFVIRTYVFPVGSYMIATNERLQVNVFFREFRMTVRQIINKFGRVKVSNEIDWTNISSSVKHMYYQGSLEAWIDICHVIVPNEDYNPERQLYSKDKKFSSCYYEKGSMMGSSSSANYMNTEPDKYLSEKGYDYFPVLCPRWEITGEDTYGTSCPGMDALPDIKSLQTMQKRKLAAIEKMVNPPMVGPTALRNLRPTILPGDMTFIDEREGTKGFRPAHEVNPRIQELLLDIQDHHQRISRAFFEDLFLMLAQSDRRDITAREIDERHEEKLLALGPVLEQLNQDLLDPMTDITFDLMFKRRMFEKPPPEAHGLKLKVEYISIMAQAQKVAGVAGIDRFIRTIGAVAQFKPRILDKVDEDQLVDVYGDFTSVPPNIILSDDKVAEVREKQAKASQQTQNPERLQQGTAAVKQLSEVNLESDNPVTRILNQARQSAQQQPVTIQGDI